jgi:ankyrin repeat protein
MTSSSADFNDNAVSYGPKNDQERKLLEAMADGRASRGLIFGCTMQGASLSCTSDQPETRGWTPLMFAMKNRDDEAIETLLHFSADPDRQNAAGDTALMIIIKDRRKSSEPGENTFAMNDFYISRQLIREYEDDKLCHINIRNRDGKTALFLAAETGQWDFVERLLEAGADCMVADAQERTVLDAARAAPGHESFNARQAMASLERLTAAALQERERQAALKQAAAEHIEAGLPALKDVTLKPTIKLRK